MRAIDEIYDAICDEAAYARLPAVAANAVAARSAIIMEFDQEVRPLSICRHGISDAQQNRFTELGLAQHDVWTHLAVRGRLNRVVISEEHIDQESFRRTVFYNELFHYFRDDTGQCMGVVMSRPDGYMSIGLHRAFGQRQFEEQDAGTLDELLPHLRRLNNARARLQLATNHGALLSTVLDELSCGLAIVGADGQLRHANRAAEALLRAKDGVAVQGGRVVPVHQPMAARFAEAVRSAATATGARGDAMRLQRSGASPLNALIVPIAGALPGALVLLDTQDREASMSPMLVRLYGLTPTEAELAAMLGLGFSPEEAAAARDVRISTVRSQIKALLHKTETRRLGDLLRTLGRASRLN